MTTFERLKKMISKGMYIAEELTSDIKSFVEINLLSTEEELELLTLMELYPGKEIATYKITNDNSIYLLLLKQIEKMYYPAEVIEKMVADFKLTGTIDKYQFNNLIALINEKYHPVIEEMPTEDPQEII